MTKISSRINTLTPEQRALIAQKLQQKLQEKKAYDEHGYPLSPGQRMMWFVYQIAPQSSAYNVGMPVSINVPIQPNVLRRVLTHVVQRHPILRTTYREHDGKPVQKIHADLPIGFDEVDATHLSQEQLDATIYAVNNRPVDLEHGPILKAHLFRRSSNDDVLLLSIHHIALDFWSIGVLLEEIATLYLAECMGADAQLPLPRQQYTDYVQWQSQKLEGPEREKLETYWRQQLAGPLPILDLPSDHPRPTIPTFQGATERLTLPPALTSEIRQMAANQGKTLYALLLAAFKILLYRYSGQSDLIVASPVLGNRTQEFMRVVGLFSNVVALRTKLSGNQSFNMVVSQVHQTVLEALDHQTYPFGMLTDMLKIERDPSRAPITDVAFGLNSSTGIVRAEGGAPGGPRDIELRILPLLAQQEGQYDLYLELADLSGTIEGGLRYNTDLFEAATIARMAEQYHTLLTSIVRTPELPIAALPLLTAAERTLLLTSWNATARPLPALGVHHLVEAQAAQRPDAVAVVDAATTLSYADLNRRANQLAHLLHARGLGPDVLVGVALDRSVELLIAVLAILKAGGAYLPLDLAFPPARLQFMLHDAQVGLVLSHSSLRDQLPAFQGEALWLDHLAERCAALPTTNLDLPVIADQLAYTIYTSGSTGQPKGVQVGHAALTNFLLAMQQQPGLSADDVLLAVTTLAFDIAALELFLPLTVGARVVLLPRDVAIDAALLAQAITDTGATVLQATPATWQALLTAEWSGAPQLRVLCGGEALPRELAQQLVARTAGVWNMYGPTETTVWSTCTPITAATESVHIGGPIANTTVYVLDRSMQPVPIGAIGELYIGGVGVARGYLKRPALTAEKFVPDALSSEPGRRLYRTGDLARWRADGTLECLGRADQQVKLRGFRIEVDEIAAVLSQHGWVAQAAVALQGAGTPEARLVGYLVASTAHPVAAEASGTLLQSDETETLRQWLREQLPEYMVPALLVWLPELPRTPNGKLDRKALPVVTALAAQQQKTGPRTEVETVMVLLWAEVLGVAQVGIHDDFFALGGHSLLAMMLLTRIRQQFHVNLPLRALFEARTVSAVAHLIETQRNAPVAAVLPSILPQARTRALPLSFAQSGLWFIDQLQPGNPAYNMIGAGRIRGPLDSTALQRSFDAIVQRHESLRTVFTNPDGQPQQVVLPAIAPLALPVLDLQTLPEHAHPAAIQQHAVTLARQPFDLQQGPLLRLLLLRTHADTHILVFAMHHIIGDGWSFGVMIRELSLFYSAWVAHQPPVLPELPIQYGDFAVWQRQWFQGAARDTHLAYWQNQLAHAPRVVELPTDRPRPAVERHHGTSHTFVLPAELVEEVRALSQAEGATLFMTLLAAFKVLVYTYTGQERVVVGTDAAGRSWAEVEPLIGLFVNMLVLHTDLGGAPSFRETLRRVREVALGAFAHQHLPFNQLVQELVSDRDPSRHPLFQLRFTVQNTPMPDMKMGDLQMTQMEIDYGIAQLDINVRLWETDAGIEGSIQYNTDLFEAATIARMAEQYHTLLTSIVRTPELPIAALPLLTAAERTLLLTSWNATARPLPALGVHHLVEAQAAQHPDAVAVVDAATTLSYADLNRRANQLAHLLHARGLRPDVLVGVALDRSVELLIAVLAILKAGGAYLPLDLAFPPARLQFMLHDAQVGLVLSHSSLRDQLPPFQGEALWLDHLAERCAALPTTNLDLPVIADQLAYTIYTSGSTGQPKGVQVGHAALTNFLLAMQQQPGLSADDVLLAVTTLAFDIAALELFLPLTVGARVVLLPRDVAIDAALLAQAITDTGATVLQATPATWQALLTAEWSGAPQLRVLCGGEALPRELAQQLVARTAGVWNMYGPTETTVWSTCTPITAATESVHIGGPIANTTVYVLDRSMQPVPIGAIGELYIGGVGVARGYLKRPALTAETFVPDALSSEPGRRLYRTGDLARWRADGTLECLGRADQQVKLRGFRIEVDEIAAVLSQHGWVAQAAVALQGAGTPEARLVGYLVASTAHPVAAEASGTLLQSDETETLRAWLRDHLPEYMVPALLVWLPELPRTPNGKLDRKALPVVTALAAQQQKTEPRTPLEADLAALWAEVVGVAQVGIHDDFFAIGGHSLMATLLLTRMRQQFHVNLPLNTLFETRTVSAVAHLIETQRSTPAADALPPIMPQTRTRALPLSFAQSGLWFIDQLQPGSPIYNMAGAARMTGNLDCDALQGSFNALVQRHETLRTVFTNSQGEPQQVVLAEIAPLALPVLDLQALPEHAHPAAIQQHAVALARQPFDLQQGPLLRLLLLRTHADTHILVFAMHHIVGDGWSFGVMIRELSLFYSAWVAHQPPILPELPIQYGDFAVWQRQWFQGAARDTHLAYWQNQLAHAPRVVELPSDHPRPAVERFHGTYHTFVLPTELVEEVRALSQAEGATLFMTLLAAFKVLVYTYTGQERVVVGTDAAGRSWAEVEPLIGLFVNILVLHTDLSGTPSFREALRRVREVALGAFAHQHLPFSQLVQELVSDRDPSRHPLFQMRFTVQNAPMPDMKMGDLQITHMEIDYGIAQLDINVRLWETGTGIEGSAQYNTDLFEAATIARFFHNFTTLVQAIVAQPDTPLSGLAAKLLEADRQQQRAQHHERKELNAQKLKRVMRQR